jgi:hypothetical protein
MEMLNLLCSLCYVAFINLISVAAGVWRQRLALSIVST